MIPHFPQPHDRNGFKTAIFCALPLEAEMVKLIFDKYWDSENHLYGRAPADHNSYTLGAIGGQNVVLVHLPGVGTNNAAIAAASLGSSFPSIRLVFIVGICGAVPFHPQNKEEIVLGDCLVATTIIRYDSGRQYPQGFVRQNSIEESLGRPNIKIRSWISKLKTQRKELHEAIFHHLEALQKRRPEIEYPGTDRDLLFEPSYSHKHRGEQLTCSECETSLEDCKTDCTTIGCEADHLVKRDRLYDTQNSYLSAERVTPVIHFGRFGSGDIVMKSGLNRDLLSSNDKLIAFEMEGSGIWDSFPTMVVKSACDYADSHKSKEWQLYAAATAACALKALFERWIPSEEPLEADSIYMIPPLRNQFFVGRQNKLRELETRLLKMGQSRLAIYGLGGIGKTQLALAFCQTVKSKYPDYSIFWMSAISRARFIQDCTKIARACSINAEPGEDNLLSMVQEYLSNQKSGKWVLVVDNADDPRTLFEDGGIGSTGGSFVEFLPQSEVGCILFTTRYKDIAVDLAHANVISLQELSFEEAETFLISTLQQDDITKDKALVKELLEELTYLPLAVVQAASYIIKTSITIPTYLKMIRRTEAERIKLLSREFRDGTREKESNNAIATTWLVSFDQIKQYEPEAAELLFFLAFLENKAIPMSILPPVGTHGGDLTHAIGVLIGYSFLSKQGDEDTYDMHRLVHHTVKVWMEMENVVDLWKQEAIAHIAAIFPYSKMWETRNIWRDFVPHIIRCLRDSEDAITDRHADLCLNLGKCLELDGRTSEAVRWISKCVKWRNRKYHEDDNGRLYAQHSLATAYLANREIVESVTLLEQVVAIGDQVLEVGHPQRLESQHQLARAYRRNGQVEKAVDLMEQAVLTQESILPPDSISLLDSQHQLARAYRKNGQLTKAVILLEKVVAIKATLFPGGDHPSRVQSEHALALAYRSDDRVREAIAVLENVVTIRKRVLRQAHPDLLGSQRQLAMTYESNGQLDKAVLVMRDVVKVQGKVLSTNNPRRGEDEALLATMLSKLLMEEANISGKST